MTKTCHKLEEYARSGANFAELRSLQPFSALCDRLLEEILLDAEPEKEPDHVRQIGGILAGIKDDFGLEITVWFDLFVDFAEYHARAIFSNLFRSTRCFAEV